MNKILDKECGGIKIMIKWLKKKYVDIKWKERKISLGNQNREKTFYIVRRSGSKAGLFSIVMTSLGYINYAVEQGYVPVVELNYGEQRKTQKNIGINWEDYFEQPCNYRRKDICHSKNIILGNGIVSTEIVYPGENIAHDMNALNYWRNITKQYLHVKEEIVSEANMLAKELLDGKKTLGLLVRGTDYVNMKPSGHPIQPSVEEVISKTDEIMKEYGCDRIYLATEDEGIYRKLKARYGDMLVAMKAQRYTTKGNENINDISRKNQSESFIFNKNYLINILILSKCDYLIAGNTGGTQGALLLTNGYEYSYVYDLGVY